ncbi:MAG: TIGR04013 family B12-binding domain/radical SAM domain-containing protein [Acidobacteria bacterium]|nr:TIGR04013 family B12-binding domain/radical SAM domain-containing protein [Acidobacteriota bacterium]
MKPLAILFVKERYNRYSLAALTGALESAPGSFIPEIRLAAPMDVPDALDGMRHEFGQVILACSFHTANVPEVAGRVGRWRKQVDRSGWAVRLLAGGAHATGDPYTTLRIGFHLVLRGEGETTLPELCRRLAVGESLDDLPGLARLTETGLVANPLPPPHQLDDFAPYSERHRLFAPLEISRGCPCSCRFCQTPQLMGRRMRHRSLPEIERWIRIMRGRGMHDLRFISPNAFAYGSRDGRTPDPEVVERLLRLAADVFGRAEVYFGSYPSEVRPDSVTDELVRLVRRFAINDNLVIGAQTGSERLLRKLRRGHTLTDVFRAVEIAVAHGFRPYVDFIFALPDETESDRQDTRRAMAELSRLGAVIHTHTFMPLPGTPLQDAVPREVDPETRELLRHTEGGNLCGEWERQEKKARQTYLFLQRLRAIVPEPDPPNPIAGYPSACRQPATAGLADGDQSHAGPSPGNAADQSVLM